jgi:hypothetical protein
MRTLAIACAAVSLLAASASARELAVSKSTLDRMGLGTMQKMSDDDGIAVRGKGSGVWGGSTASWGTQSSSNYYSAGSSWLGKGSSAGGNTFSFSGNFQFFQFGW